MADGMRVATLAEVGRRRTMVQQALAEAGWPQVDVFLASGVVSFWPRGAPHEAIWRAAALVAQAERIPMPCWPCWQAAGHTQRGRPERGCPHDTWTGAPPVVRPA